MVFEIGCSFWSDDKKTRLRKDMKMWLEILSEVALFLGSVSVATLVGFVVLVLFNVFCAYIFGRNMKLAFTFADKDEEEMDVALAM